MVRVQGSSVTPRRATLAFESLRRMQEDSKPLPGNGTVGVLFHDNQDRLAWCYRNQSSAWAERLRAQNSPEMVARAKDPILHRTAGGVLSAPNFNAPLPTRWRASVRSRPLIARSASCVTNRTRRKPGWRGGTSACVGLGRPPEILGRLLESQSRLCQPLRRGEIQLGSMPVHPVPARLEGLRRTQGN